MNVGILGFGHVASAAVQQFIANRDVIASKVSRPIEIIKVGTRTTSKAIGQVPDHCEVVDDCWSVVDDPRVDVVIEALGGTGIAKDLVMRAIDNGKHIITANKALLAVHGREIFALAEKKSVCVLFEAAVSVSIPIIKTLKESAAANRISSVTGILNGTSNFILSQMCEQGKSFQEALALAQEMGYAEADPTLDVNGEDAAHKLTLLATLAFGIPVNFNAIHCEGITQVDMRDVQYAQALGYEVKLIAQASSTQDGVALSVEPTLVPQSNMLAQVKSSMNGIHLQGDLFGSAFLYGSGAGGKQTSSAILSDLIDLVTSQRDGQYVGHSNLGFMPEAISKKDFISRSQQVHAFYLRALGTLPEHACDELALLFTRIDLPLQSIKQVSDTEVILQTRAITRIQLDDALTKIQASGNTLKFIALPILNT